MNIKKYFETIFNSEIAEEVNLNWDGLKDLLVIKRLDGGKNTTQAKTIPFQLQLYTLNALEGKRLFDEFISANNNIIFKRDLETIIPNYFPPIVIPNINAQGNGYYYQVVMSGIFQVATNIDDVVKIEIDGNEVLTEKRTISYITVPDTQGKSINRPNVESKIKSNQIQMNLILNSVNNSLMEKLRKIRKRELDPNTLFNIKLTFSSNEVENYNLICFNSSINSENGAFPTISLQLGE